MSRDEPATRITLLERLPQSSGLTLSTRYRIVPARRLFATLVPLAS